MTMKGFTPKLRALWNRLAALPRDASGAFAIEFGAVIPVFLLLLLGIIELGMMVFVQSVLDGSARDAARLIRTGQVQSTGNPQQAFQTLLCNEMAALVGCANLLFDVQTFANFTAAQTGLNQPIQVDPNGNPVNVNFTPGGAKQIVTVRVMYNRPFYTALVGQWLGGATDSALLMSTVVFVNEPFGAS
jgi:Flp pilus assembly protein TadG